MFHSRSEQNTFHQARHVCHDAREAGPCLAGPRIPPPGVGGTGADLDRLLRCLVLPCNRHDSNVPVFPHGASMTRQPHSRITRGSLTQRPRPTAPRLLGPSCIGAAELELPCPHKGETRKFFSSSHHPEQDFRDPTSLPTLRRWRETLSLLVAKQRHAATSPNTNIHTSHHRRPAGCQK